MVVISLMVYFNQFFISSSTTNTLVDSNFFKFRNLHYAFVLKFIFQCSTNFVFIFRF